MKDDKTLINNTENYKPDVLGRGFERLTFNLKEDYEGQVTATLIRKKSVTTAKKAVLYLHGFNDYFFQEEMALQFNQHGFHFYALDLRKYGRSYLPHQKLNNVRSLVEYDEEINRALHLIKSEENELVLLKGHSTGGLIVTYYAVRHLNNTMFDGIICNSPFYNFNLPFMERELGIPLLSVLATFIPNFQVDAGFSDAYGHSLHKDKQGEWNYSLLWKPHHIPKVNLGFIRAIYKAQQHIQNQNKISVPLLVLFSDQSITEKRWSEKFQIADAVLNVKQIKEVATQLKGDVTTCEIKEAIHDVVLSKISVRENVYKKIFEWCAATIN